MMLKQDGHKPPDDLWVVIADKRKIHYDIDPVSEANAFTMFECAHGIYQVQNDPAMSVWAVPNNEGAGWRV